MPRSDRPSTVEAAIGGYDGATKEFLVPMLLYKSVFLGEWFEALVAQERDPTLRELLALMTRSTLREAIELLDVTRAWEATGQYLENGDLAAQLQRRILFDLILLKEGSTEAVLFAAMRAPTAALRDRLVELADLDRKHADDLRAALNVERAVELARRNGRRGGAAAGAAVGAHEGRAPGDSLSASVATRIEELARGGAQATRLVLSPSAHRHLRDEGRVRADGTAFGLSVDVDFGWSGECFAIVTSERVRLAELLTSARDDPSIDRPRD